MTWLKIGYKYLKASWGKVYVQRNNNKDESDFLLDQSEREDSWSTP